MKIIITESQFKTLQELSFKSAGVSEFIDKVKDTPGLLKHLGFPSIEDLKDYILDGNNRDFDELKADVKEFFKEK